MKPTCRGIYLTEGLNGTSTFIARDEHNRYAFYRGKTPLGKTRQRSSTTKP